MKIKEGCDVSTMEFWYDLTDGGYIKPSEILENPDDIANVEKAIAIVKEFERSCEDQIPGFVQ